MFDLLIEEIQNAVKPQLVENGGKHYSSKPLHLLPQELTAKALHTATLQSVADYIANHIDDTKDVKLFVHIADYDRVRVCRYLNDDRNREILLEASFEPTNFRFSHQYDQESFITLLQSSFVGDANRKNLQKVVGGLTDESSVRLQDDGISQETVAKAGVTIVERVKIENPVTLRPFRTFAEIEQPESPFIFRLHRREGHAPQISLHEADNAAWKLTAIQSIKKFLENKIKDTVIIA